MTAIIKKIVLLVMPIPALILTAYFCAMPTAASAPDKLTVVIDAGHGGIDGGAVSNDKTVYESDVNLNIAEKLKARFLAGGFNVVMTRSTANGLYGVMSKGFKRRDMEERVKIAERAKADALISVHLNKYSDPSRRGAQAFYNAADEKSKRLAECVQEVFNKTVNTKKSYAALKGDYYLLNETSMPAIICECGFISNPEDLKLLVTNEYAKELANVIFSGTVNFFASA